MNISVLTVKMMLNLSARWLEHEGFVQRLLAAGPLGVGILGELEAAHEGLTGLTHRRRSARERVRELIERCQQLDRIHDRKARGLYRILDGLIDVSDDEQAIAGYRGLQAILFPDGLRVTRLPYIEAGGTAVELDRAIGPALRKELAAVSVGGQTLEQVFEAWMAAGHALGEAVRERAELQASLARGGSRAKEIDLRGGRNRWLQAVRGLLWAIEIKAELGELGEPVEASLAAAIETARRRRTGGEDIPADDGAGADESELDDEASADESEDGAVDDMPDAPDDPDDPDGVPDDEASGEAELEPHALDVDT